MLILWLIMLLVGNRTHPIPVPTYAAPLISPQMLETVKKETVLISVEGWGGIGRGTGVLIDSKHVLTCAHMTGHEGQMWIYTYPLGRVLTAKPVWGDMEHDLAILELSQPVKLDHYAVFNSSIAIGQPIVVVGNTLGAMKWFTSYGIISESDFFFLLTDATIYGGNSGGPWLNLKGEIVALTDWGLAQSKTNTQISGGINAATIQKFLKDWKNPNMLQIIIGG